VATTLARSHALPTSLGSYVMALLALLLTCLRCARLRLLLRTGRACFVPRRLPGGALCL
jgi:hypothetical protein